MANSISVCPNDLARRRALITGGAGFIGSHLVDRLVQEGFHIGTGEGIAANVIFTHLAWLTGYERPPNRDPARRGEVFKIFLDVRKAQEKLCWAPNTDLQYGLGLTVK